MKKLTTLFVALSTLIVGCGDSTSPTNKAPIIATITASPAIILDSVTSALSVTATDSDGDALGYAWSAANGTISGTGASVTYNPSTVNFTTAQRIDVTVTDGRGGSVSGFVDISVSPAPPIVVNNGQLTEWTAVLTTIGNAVYSPLAVVFTSNNYVVSGSARDNINEVDVASIGTIDGAGHIVLAAVMTNAGSPRATIIFTGDIVGPQASQTFSGTYSATGPSVTPTGSTETGTFSMSHS